MKTLKETYQIVLDHLISPKQSICIAAIDCLHNGSLLRIEMNSLHNHLRKLKPRFYHREFYRKSFNSFNRTSYDNQFEEDYWWSFSEAGLKRRKLFVKKIIESL